jgi:hypothetical protein
LHANRYAQGGRKKIKKFSSQFAGQARKSASNFLNSAIVKGF